MLNTIGALEAGKLGSAPCKPDPEEMLENARNRKAEILMDIQAFEAMGSYYIPDSEKYALMLYGAMHKAFKDAEQAEEYWLNEIDAD